LIYLTNGIGFVDHPDFDRQPVSETSEGFLYEYTGTSGTAYFDFQFEIPNAYLVVGSNTYKPGIRIREAGLFTSAVTEHSYIFVVNTSTISGNTLSCNGNVSFSLNNYPHGSSITWQILQSDEIVTQGTGTNAQASSLSDGDGQVTFTESFSCGLSTEEIVKNFWVGVPSPPTTYPESPIYQSINTVFNVSIVESPGANPSTGTWETICSVTPNGTPTGQIASFFSCNDDGRGVIYISTSNECGSYYKTAFTVITGDDGECEEESKLGFESSNILIYPNPATEFIDITIPSANDEIISKSIIYIFDMFSRILEKIPMSSYCTRINISNLPKGTYLLLIRNNKGEIFSKFVKQ
jgi:hypothetical protein